MNRRIHIPNTLHLLPPTTNTSSGSSPATKPLCTVRCCPLSPTAIRHAWFLPKYLIPSASIDTNVSEEAKERAREILREHGEEV